ncbi:MAG: hypothetical protein ACYTGT_06260 [Planctomycetota bacterium]|jgi:hypothetical protein
MKNIQPGYLHPSAAFTIKRSQIKRYQFLERAPEVGDLVYGRVTTLGHHQYLENCQGRIHSLLDGSRAIFVYGNRYAPDHYEGVVPSSVSVEVDMLARSGVVGVVRKKNSVLQDPTRIRVLGYVCDADGNVLNTRSFPLIRPQHTDKKPNRSKMILVVGTSMNSGKSVTAAACCWSLTAMGHTVRASKITGTASLRDILRMNDCGATIFNDFTHLGYPSTYLLDLPELLHIFNSIDLKYANSPKNFWIVELADGILQRETEMLLASPDVKSRIHRLVFNASDALGCVGGLTVLREHFGLEPDAISGICSSSPLALQELARFSSIPVFNNMEQDLRQISELLL